MGAGPIAGLAIHEEEQQRRRDAIARLGVIKRVLRDISDPFAFDD